MFAIYKTNERFLLAGKPYYDDQKKKKKIVFYRLIDTGSGLGFKAKDGKLQNVKNVGTSILYDYTQNMDFAKDEGTHFQNDILNDNNIYVTSIIIDEWAKNEGFEEFIQKK